jgi:hypothetical protein
MRSCSWWSIFARGRSTAACLSLGQSRSSSLGRTGGSGSCGIDHHPRVGLDPRSRRSLGRAVTNVLPRTHLDTGRVVEQTADLIITWKNRRRVAERRHAGTVAGSGGYVAYRLGLNVPIVLRMVDFGLRAVVVSDSSPDDVASGTCPAQSSSSMKGSWISAITAMLLLFASQDSA